ncbi:MAG TPA: pyridoxal phosphate-dependent aminotransferase [Edaphocola sp.]|nr:pyridoxal phosphate-dependent aminotransferase [Edaphocola sp.]
MQISNFVNRFGETQTLLMAKLTRELISRGIDVINLSLGEPDFDTPEHIKTAAKNALDEGYTKYTPVSGILELKKAICTKFENDNNLYFQPENIIISTGAKQSLANAILAIINEGDEAIIPTPYWVTYSAQVEMALGKPVFVHCDVSQQFKMTPAQLEAAINDKTRLLIFSSPCNPSGAIYTKEELAGLVKVIEKYPEVYVISDEIYEYINYEGVHESIAQFETIKDRVILINGFSKGYAMTGWRLGYLAASVPIVKACEKIQGQFTSGANSIAQHAAVAAVLGSQDPTKEMVKAFKARRDYFLNALSEIEGFQVIIPQGAFYAFPNIKYFLGKKDKKGRVINNADDFAIFLLNSANVSGVSGAAFGNDGCIRFSYATSLENLHEAIKRIKEAVGSLE